MAVAVAVAVIVIVAAGEIIRTRRPRSAVVNHGTNRDIESIPATVRDLIADTA